MENNRRSSSRLRDRFARMFRSPSLLRSACNTSTSAAPSASRYLINDAASAELGDDSLGRSLSFPVRNDLSPFPSLVGRRRRPSLGQSSPPPTMAMTEKEEHAPASSCFNKAMEEEEVKRKRRRRKKKDNKKRFLSNGYGFSSSSSAESDDDGSGGFFSSEDEEGGEARKKKEDEMATETTFLSSRSFSSDSSEFYQNPKNKNKKRHRLPALRRIDRRPARKAQHEGGWGVCRGLSSPAVVPPSSSAAGRRREEERRKRGFAVVKRSSDPYNDFRSSMVEMIMERQLFGARDLENLLRSYLCLNSPHLHLVILRAFSDIRTVLFSH